MYKKIRKDASGNPDVSLIKGLLDGDQIAYSRLLGKYYDMVFLIVAALEDDHDDEHIRKRSSDILLSLWANRATISPDISIKEQLFDFIYKQFKENGGKI
jgi:hypothetical protein